MCIRDSNIGHVGGEGTQALLNALLVPDVREHILKHGQLGAVEGGDVKLSLIHIF